MADLSSLLTTIPGLISDFTGSTSDPYAAQKKQLADRMSAMSAAQGDTSNPLYQQVYGQYQDQNRQNLANTVAQLQGQNRMNQQNGRTPLFDPSRGGEQLFRAITQGQQSLGVQSDQEARSALSQGLGGAGAAGSFYNQITPGAAKANTQQLSGFTGLSNLFQGSNTPAVPSAYGSMSGSPANPNYTNPNAGVFPQTSNYSALSGTPSSSMPPNMYGLGAGGWSGN